MTDEQQRLCEIFNNVVGEAGCGVSCFEADIFKENGEWKIFLEGFMEPWPMGRTIEEFETNLREYAAQGFGLS